MENGDNNNQPPPQWPAQQPPQPADPDVEIEVKYFDMGEGYSCVQMSTQMTEDAFQGLTAPPGG